MGESKITFNGGMSIDYIHIEDTTANKQKSFVKILQNEKMLFILISKISKKEVPAAQGHGD